MATKKKTNKSTAAKTTKKTPAAKKATKTTAKKTAKKTTTKKPATQPKEPARKAPKKAAVKTKTDKKLDSASQIDLAAQVGELGTMTLAQLRRRHKEVFGMEIRAKNKTMLAKKIAKQLQRLAETGKPIPETTPKTEEAETEGTANPANEKPKKKSYRKKGERDPRLPAAGTVLTREYKGRKMEVTVLEEGFELDGKGYRSLSKIASEVAGCSYNGFLFFGLTQRPARKAE